MYLKVSQIIIRRYKLCNHSSLLQAGTKELLEALKLKIFRKSNIKAQRIIHALFEMLL